MNRAGTLLIAHPNLPANNPFSQAVIYLTMDNDKGVHGVVLNKPSQFKVFNIVAEYGFEASHLTGNVHAGGPVFKNKLSILHSSEWTTTSSVRITKDVCISSDTFMIEKLSSTWNPIEWRMFAGMCAWQPGQLELELSGKHPYRPENSWLTANASSNILFNYDGEKQWEKALQLSSQQMINQFF